MNAVFIQRKNRGARVDIEDFVVGHFVNRMALSALANPQWPSSDRSLARKSSRATVEPWRPKPGTRRGSSGSLTPMTRPTCEKRWIPSSAANCCPSRRRRHSFDGSKGAVTSRGTTSADKYLVRTHSREGLAGELTSRQCGWSDGASAGRCGGTSRPDRLRSDGASDRSSVRPTRRRTESLGVVPDYRQRSDSRHRDDRATDSGGRVESGCFGSRQSRC
jgi:hypothetical protein